MADLISIRKLNDVYIRVDASESVMRELHTYFTLEVPGAKYSPQARKGQWDGTIKLMHMNGRIYAGLHQEIRKFALDRGYDFEFDNPSETYSYADAETFFRSIDIPSKFDERDFQLNTLTHAVQEKRALFLSPTASGKSLSIYLLYRYFNEKTLLIVPTSHLLLQMQGDFKEYGYDQPISQYGDKIKDDCNQLVVATWQSVYENDEEWFSQFGMVIVDESHLAAAKSLKGIMEKMPHCPLRFGFTGTLNGTKTHRLVLEGLFGPTKRVATTAELIKRGILSPFKVKSIKFNHPEWARKYVKDNASSYQDEVDFLLNNDRRNRAIRNLALSLKGNTLILFYKVEKHGQVLYEMIKAKCPDRQVFYIHGGIEAEERERIRSITEKHIPEVIMTFRTKTIKIPQNIEVQLTNGQSKLSQDITKDDDISDVWLYKYQ